MAANILERTMRGDIIWSLDEADDFREEMAELEAKVNGSAKSPQRTLRKKRMKRLRKKLRNLTCENANTFSSVLEIDIEYGWFKYVKKVDARIVIVIGNGETTLKLYKRREFQREEEWVLYGSISSHDYPEMNTFHFILRNEETTRQE